MNAITPSLQPKSNFAPTSVIDYANHKPASTGYPLSVTEREILRHIAARCGCATNAYDLIVRQIGRDWRWGYRCIRRLESRGMVTITKSGKELTIRVVAQ